MEQWVVATKKADFQLISEKFKIDPIIARIIRNRNIIEDEKIDIYLNGNEKHIASPFLMYDLEKAINLLNESVEKKEKIRIIGDYDIDGVCSTYILYQGLRQVTELVDYMIPHRMKDGYGLHKGLIHQAFEEGIHTIITCDNGISACEEIQYGKSLGMKIIITDHHEVSYEQLEDGQKVYVKPMADAIVNPKQQECQYPYQNICGGVVAYKVIQGYFLQYGIDAQLVLDELLEFAALATVGDVMELTDENRIITKMGLSFMRNTKNIGLQSLMEACGIESKNLTTYHLGFVLGPCLNATGRLDSAAKAMEMLLCRDKQEARKKADELKQMNDTRKKMTLTGVEQAKEAIEQMGIASQKVFVIYLPDCHESLAGIIAGRIREYYKKPTFILTKAEEGVKGSGRSIEAFHMYEEMIKCKQYFVKFGGHKLAAGLSMKEEDIPLFAKEINDQCTLTEADFVKKVTIDVPMPPSYITTDLIKQFSVLEPFGVGNPKPIFAFQGLIFLTCKIFGKNNNVGKFRVVDNENNYFNVIYFGDLEPFFEYISQKEGEQVCARFQNGETCKIPLSIIYYPDINEYGGRQTIQLIMNSYQ